MSASWSRSRGERAERRGGGIAVALIAPLLTLSAPSARADDVLPPVPGLSVTACQDQATLARDLPSSRTVWSLLETVEPTAILDRIDGAGLHLGEPGRFSMRGASWTQNRFVLDGVDLTDPAGGVPLLLPDVDVFATLEVTSALAPVELGTPGVTMTLSPRSPSGAWGGTLQGYGLGPGLQAGGTADMPPAIARFGSLGDVSAVVGGPIVGERLRLLLSGHVARVRRTERSAPAVLTARLLSGTGDLTWRPGERDVLRLFLAGQAVERPFAARARFFGDPVTERAETLGGVVSWTRTGDGATASVRAGLWSGVFEPQAEGRDATHPIERVLDGPVPTLVFPARSRRSSWSVDARLALPASPLGRLSHAARFGLSARRAGTSDRPGHEAPIPETVGGLAARVWEYAWAGRDARRHVLDLAGWAAERLTWGDRLVVEAGLRVERTTGAAEGALQGIAWTSLVPRVSARLRLTDHGLTLFGGWAEYRHRLLTEHLAFGNPNGPQGAVSLWTDTNGDGLYSPDERGVLVAREGPGSGDGTLTSIDPELRQPRTRELVAGVEASPGGGVVVRLAGFDRRGSDLLESVDVGVPPSGYTVRYLPDPGGDIVSPQDDQLLPVFDRRPETFGLDRYRLTNAAGHTGLHQAVELRVEKALGRRFALLGGATVSRTEIQGGNRGFRVLENDQGVVGELFDDPNADTYARGRGYFDRAYTIKLATAWRPGRNWRFGVVARYQDGQPFGRLVVVPDLAQGPEAVPATTRGQTLGRIVTTDPEGRPLSAEGHRFTYTLTLDVRVEKGISLGAGRLALVAEAFNLLGTRHEVEENSVWGPGFRDPTAVQPPRVLRLGARFDF